MQHVAVLGAGERGCGIAVLALTHDCRVSLIDTVSGLLDSALDRIEAGLEFLVERDLLDQQARRDARDALTISPNLDHVADADITIDASEPEAARGALLADVGALLAPEAIIAISTETGSITALAASTPHPGRVVGMHFPNPALASKLVEIVPGLRTEGWVTDRAAELARAWGKTPVESRNRPGFISNRVSLPFASEAIAILDDGVTTAGTVDALIEAMGFRNGPFAHLDEIGLEAFHMRCLAMYDGTFGEARYRPSTLVAEMLEAGLRGRESGEGFYDYRSE